MEFDHALIAVADLEAAAHELEAQHGLASVEGGRHPGWGTANRIVPLGDTYLELVAIVDRAEAAQSPLGKWIGRAKPGVAKPLGWAVRPGGLDAVAGRLSLTIQPGSRLMPDGEVLRWRLAGLEQAIAEPPLPFFIEWADGTPFPGRAAVSHPAGPVRIEALQLAGDADRLAEWLGPHLLPIRVRSGRPALESIVLSGAPGEIVAEVVAGG
jgi:Glyoxalase-like domain